jgi:radical SAM-linked protein
MRLRITFSKSGALRYTGHLDLQTIWERTIRRAGLPLIYTQGFHPGPRIQLAAALPLGFTGRAEIVDVWVVAEDDALDRPYQKTLQPAAPPGLVITNVEMVDEHAPALQTQVISADYEVSLLEPADKSGLERKIAALLGAVSLIRERRNKRYDLRPLIEVLELMPEESSAVPRLFMRLAAREGATGRPEEVINALGLPSETTRIERISLIIK